MAKVPYSPVPEVALAGGPIRAPSVNTPPEAFGAGIAQAQQGFGQELDRVGNELFARASAIQQLNNETDARAADTDYMIKAGALHAEYQSLQGKDRVTAFPSYAQNLKDLRLKIRGGLTNPTSQRMFDSQSMGTLGRSIFNGAGAAASANKDYTLKTTAAQLEMDIKSIEDDPSEGNFLEKTQRIASAARSLAAQQGLDGASEDLLVLKSTSKAQAQRIIGLSRTAPFEAAKLLEKYKTGMTSDDFLKTESMVRTRENAVGASNIASEVYDRTKTLEQMEAEVKAKAEALSPKNETLDEAAIAALRTKYNQAKYADKQEVLQAREEIDGLIQMNSPKNMQELLAIPNADTLVQRLPKTEQLALPGKINRYQASVSKYDNELRYTGLRGMAASDDPEAREAFLNIDPTKENLSQAQIRSVMELQRKMKLQTSGDPRVVKAVTYLRGAMGAQLEALGIFKRTEDNVEDYDNFVGTLQSALDVWQETHKAPATYKDIVETIGPQIIRERTEPGFFNIGGYGTTKQVPFFKQEVPESFAARARHLTQNPNMPDAEIYKLYVRMQYKALYGKPAAKTQDQVK